MAGQKSTATKAKDSSQKKLETAKSSGQSGRNFPSQLLQQRMGNKGAGQFLQAKLTVGQPNDKYEREADAVAKQVTKGELVGKLSHVPAGGLTQQLPVQLDSSQLEEEQEDSQTKLLQRFANPEDDDKKQTKALVQSKANRSLPHQHDFKYTTPNFGLENRIQSPQGGSSLPPRIRHDMEEHFDRDFSDIRLHKDTQAQMDAAQLGAKAFTAGNDIWMGRSASENDRELLAHELAHTVQQDSASAGSIGANSQHWATASIQRQSTETTSATDTNAEIAGDSTGRTDRTTSGDEETLPVTSIASTTFEPSEAVASRIESAGQRGTAIPVSVGNLATGELRIKKTRGGYSTSGYQALRFSHPTLSPLEQAEVRPTLAIRIHQNEINGYASIATRNGVAENPSALLNAIKDHSEALGWLGMDISRFPRTENKLENGELNLQVNQFQFQLGGFLRGTGDFGLTNETTTFNAAATVSIAGLAESQLEIGRNEEGKISGRVEVPVSFAKFSGNVIAGFTDGVIDIRGTVNYVDEKFAGEVTLLVTDAETARNVALEHLPPEAVNSAAIESSGAARQGNQAREGDRALAGWGTLDFSFTEWLTGRAQVIIDNEGHITVIGEITPQTEVELFPQRDYVRQIFVAEVRTLYGVPLVGNVFLFANIGLDALAKLGPGKIYNIIIRGRYSTDPDIFNEFSIEASLNISAYAGLRLRAEGGAGVELLGHDIKAGIGVNALAGVQGYVEATPTIGYREQANPEEGKAGEFYLHGHMELAAQPFLGLGGDLFVELDSPWWSPAPDKKWTWPLGELEYPLPGEFGIGADIDYVIGSGEFPEIQFGEVDFNKDKFMTDMLNDHVPRGGHAEQEQQGEWQEGETAGTGSDQPQLADSGTAPPSEEQPGRGQQQPEQGNPPEPRNEQQWQEAMQAIAAIVERSRSDPLDSGEIDTEVQQLRRRFHFTELRVSGVSEDWRLHVAMNPETDFTIQGDESENNGIINGDEATNISKQFTAQDNAMHTLSIDEGVDKELLIATRPMSYSQFLESINPGENSEKMMALNIARQIVHEFYTRRSAKYPDDITETRRQELLREKRADLLVILNRLWVQTNILLGDQGNIPTGNSPEDAIPMTWYKPFIEDLYPPIRLKDNRGETFKLGIFDPIEVLEHPLHPGLEFTLGVNRGKYLVRPNKKLLRLKERRGTKTDEFRYLLGIFDVDLSGLHADHILDLNFGGDDVFENIWLLDASANTSAGVLQNNQIVTYRDAQSGQIRTIAAGHPSMEGKFFKIEKIEG